MIDEELRRRLEALNRGPLKAKPRRAKSASTPDRSAREAVRLEAIVQGQPTQTPVGTFFLIERRLRDLVAESENLHATFSYVFDKGGGAAKEDVHQDLHGVADCDSRKMVFLDLETAGLTGASLFLAGLMQYDGRDLIVRQAFARDYSEEPGLLHFVQEALEDCEAVVTFNGKTFDLPYLRDRALWNAMDWAPSFEHVDLLHEARRRWKQILPNCRLQTLERRIGKRIRLGDIPGAEIGGVYHEFVKSQDARRIKDILHHNLMDLLALVEILVFMFRGEELTRWG